MGSIQKRGSFWAGTKHTRYLLLQKEEGKLDEVETGPVSQPGDLCHTQLHLGGHGEAGLIDNRVEAVGLMNNDEEEMFKYVVKADLW